MGKGGNSRGGISTGIHLPSRLNPTLSNNGARVIANQFRLQYASLIPPSRPKSSLQHGTFNWLRNKLAKADSSPLKRFGMTKIKGFSGMGKLLPSANIARDHFGGG